MIRGTTLKVEMILKILAIPVSTQEAERHQKWLTFSNRIKSQPGSHRFLLSVNINIGEMGVGGGGIKLKLRVIRLVVQTIKDLPNTSCNSR